MERSVSSCCSLFSDKSIKKHFGTRALFLSWGWGRGTSAPVGWAGVALLEVCKEETPACAHCPRLLQCVTHELCGLKQYLYFI